ncbi:hypothetical protein GW17_00037647 [Ensete ventricosum]|nr:hypothetical protein GW17_00037647 [Ensete ventricosum]
MLTAFTPYCVAPSSCPLGCNFTSAEATGLGDKPFQGCALALDAHSCLRGATLGWWGGVAWRGVAWRGAEPKRIPLRYNCGHRRLEVDSSKAVDPAALPVEIVRPFEVGSRRPLPNR